MSDDTQADLTTDSTENVENGSPDVNIPATAENAGESHPEGSTDDPAGDTFPREYVETLRKESAGYRDRAKGAEAKTDALARQLHSALVAATGRLADAADLPYREEHLSDPEALTAAIGALLTDKPHLKARKVAGDAGQGSRGGVETGVNLLELLRGR